LVVVLALVPIGCSSESPLSTAPDNGAVTPSTTGAASVTSSPTVVTWRRPSREAVPAILAVDPAIKDLIVIEDGQKRPLNALDAVPTHESADVFGGIEVSGEHVYFTVWSGEPVVASIWKIPFQGGRAAKFADNAANPAISPDGQLIAFGTGTPIHRLVVRELATGRERIADVGGLGTMRWSPDGRRIAITSWGEDASFVRLVDVDATELHVGEQWGNRALGSPVWLDNETLLATDTNGGGTNAPPFIVDVPSLRTTRLEGWPYFSCLDVSRSSGRLLGIVQQGSSPGALQISGPAGQIETLPMSFSYAQWAD
jgi:hypothetical protein